MAQKFMVEVLGRTVIVIEADDIREAHKIVDQRAKRGDYDEAVTEHVAAYSAAPMSDEDSSN